MLRPARLASVVLACAAGLAALGGSALPADASPTVEPRPGDVEEYNHASSGTVQITGSPGEWVTGGTTHRWTDPRSMYLSAWSGGVSLDVRSVDDWSIYAYAPKGEKLVVGKTYVAGADIPQGPTDGVATLSAFGLGKSCGTLPGKSTFRVNSLTFGEAGIARSADVSFHLECVHPAGTIDGHAVMTNRARVSTRAYTTSIERGADGVLRATIAYTCSMPSRPALTVGARQGNTVAAQGGAEVRCVPGRVNKVTAKLGEMALGNTPWPVQMAPGPATVSTESYILDNLYFDRGIDTIVTTRGTTTVRAVRTPHIRH